MEFGKQITERQQAEAGLMQHFSQKLEGQQNLGEGLAVTQTFKLPPNAKSDAVTIYRNACQGLFSLYGVPDGFLDHAAEQWTEGGISFVRIHERWRDLESLVPWAVTLSEVLPQFGVPTPVVEVHYHMHTITPQNWGVLPAGRVHRYDYSRTSAGDQEKHGDLY